MQPGLAALLQPALQGLQQLAEQQLVLLVARAQEHLQQRTQAFAPLRRGGRPGEFPPGQLQALDQGDQRAEQRGIQATDLGVGLDAVQRRALAHRVAEQHAAQAEQPAVLLQIRRHAEALALRGVQPPAHAGALDPAVQLRQVALGDAQARAQRRHVQQVEDLADRETAVRQVEQMLDGDQQRLAAAPTLVGQGEGDEARIVATEPTEHRLDVRGVAVDVRHHDDHVARVQAGVGAEACQQLVVEDLHLALRAVGDVEAQRAVPLRVQRGPAFAGLGQRAQFEDVVLQLAEQRGRRVLAEQVDALGGEQRAVIVGAVVAVQQVDVVAALLAPGGQQRLGVLVQQLGRQVGGHVGTPLLAAVLMAQQVLVGHDVRPVMAAGVVHAEQHLAEARQRAERFQRLGRQRGNAEHDDPARQAARRLVRFAQPGEEAPVHAGAALRQALGTHVGEQRAPQFGLPALLLGQRHDLAAGLAQLVAAGGPVLQPVGAVDLVLVEQVGQALGQLVALAQVIVLGEEAAQRSEAVALQQRRQQAHQPPGQRALVEQRHAGNRLAAEHRAVGLPEKGGRQLHVDGRGDAAAAAVLARVLGQRLLEPLRHAVAVHQHHFVFQRAQRIAPHPGHRQFAQRVQAVAVDDHEAGRQGLICGHGVSSSSKTAMVVAKRDGTQAGRTDR